MNNQSQSWYDSKIISIEQIATDTVCVTLTRPQNFEFIAGQYVITRITIPDEDPILRQYSFSSDPGSLDLQLIIRTKANGKASNWFFSSAKQGMCIQISNALGSFTVNRDRQALMIAGGVGVTPFLSMLREDPRNIALIYCERDNDRICHLGELSTILPSNALKILKTQSDGRLKINHVQQYTNNKPIVYLCGSFQFVTDVTELVLSAGVNIDDIVTEAFTLRPVAHPKNINAI